MARDKNPQEKNDGSSGVPRAITRHGQRADLGVLLSLEAGQKLSPRRFFALLVVALGDE